MKRLISIALVLALAVIMCFSTVALADPGDTEVTTEWAMADGTVEYQATTDSSVTNLTVTGMGYGQIATSTDSSVEETLVATGGYDGHALAYTFNASDFELNADAFGSYIVDIGSGQHSSPTVDLDMYMPCGGLADVTFEQGTDKVNVWLGLSSGGDGHLTMVGSASSSYTVTGDMEAQGSGGFGLVGSASGALDFRTAGTIDGLQFFDTDAVNVEAIAVIGSFVNGLDLGDPCLYENVPTGKFGTRGYTRVKNGQPNNQIQCSAGDNVYLDTYSDGGDFVHVSLRQFNPDVKLYSTEEMAKSDDGNQPLDKYDWKAYGGNLFYFATEPLEGGDGYQFTFD